MIAAASVDKNIYLMKFHDGDYQALSACTIANGFPVAINFTDDSTRILISTNQKKNLILDPINFQLSYLPEEISEYFFSQWLSKFPLNTVSN